MSYVMIQILRDAINAYATACNSRAADRVQRRRETAGALVEAIQTVDDELDRLNEIARWCNEPSTPMPLKDGRATYSGVLR